MNFMTLYFMQMSGKLIGKITHGIAVRDFKKGEDTQKAVFLGRFSAGADQYCARVGFLRKDPPAVNSGKVFEGRLEALENTRKKGPEDPDTFYVLAAPKPDFVDARILVRVNTEGIGSTGPDTNGTWWKEENILPFGWGKRTGTDGNTSTWLDGLILMSPGESLFVRPEGGYDVVLYYDKAKGLILISVDEYDRMPKPVVEAPAVVEIPVIAAPAPVAESAVVAPPPAKPKRSHHKKVASIADETVLDLR